MIWRYFEKWKRIILPDESKKNIQSRYRNRNCHYKCVMLLMMIGKRENNGKNRTTKSGKRLNSWKIVQLHRIIRSRHHQTRWDEGRHMKLIHQQDEKASWNQPLLQKPRQGNKNLGSRPSTKLGPFIKLIRQELRHIDQRTRKLMMMHSA